MAILAECPSCHLKQSNRNKKCKKCDTNLDRAKRSQKVKYWISYRLPNGKQRREMVGTSIEDARAAEGKRRSQKRENRLFDISPDVKMTFNELSEWYLNLEKVKALASYSIIKINLNKFNSVFGDVILSHIKPADLENYQARRFKDGKSAATVDHEIGRDNHVFQYKGSPIKGDIRDSLKNACKKAKITYGRFARGGFIFHDLRHTFNTNMRKAGVPESVIMEITGHSTREMFDRYNTVDEEDTRKAVNQLSRMFDEKFREEKLSKIKKEG